MNIHAQHRFLWSGFWVIPTLALAVAKGIHLQIGLLFWFWEIHITTRRLLRSRFVIRETYLIPTVLIQASRTLNIKFFAFRWFYGWW